MATQASAGIEELTAVLKDVRGGRGTIGQLLTNDSMYRDINALVVAAEEVARNINSGRGTLGRLATNPAAARSLEASMENLSAMTGRIRAGEGSLGTAADRRRAGQDADVHDDEPGRDYRPDESRRRVPWDS